MRKDEGMGIRHLIGIEHCTKAELYRYLNNAHSFLEVSERDIKKVPSLRGKTIINLFLEPSTRTRASFEIAGKRLSADTINITGSSSSVEKGESLLDTAETLQEMNPDVLVVRHKHSGSALFLSKFLKSTAVANAGDGMHEHPTQALLDLLSLQLRFGHDAIEGKTIAIVGDVRHSRVARSNIWAHCILGNRVRLVGPPTLIPDEFRTACGLPENVEVVHSLEDGVAGADVVMCLRMQLERMKEHFVPSLEEYTREYFVSEALLQRCAPKAVVMHPGPINRGVEVETALIDGERSLLRNQVKNGVAVRMAVLFELATSVKRALIEKEAS